jgi:hypothetical protein
MKTKSLKIPENINSDAVSQLHVAEILKQLKMKFQDSMSLKCLKTTLYSK